MGLAKAGPFLFGYLKYWSYIYSIIKTYNIMELLAHTVDPVVEHTYTVDHPTEGVLVYKEWIDLETGRCVDFVLRSKDGYEIDDAALVEDVQEFIDQNI
jgi:hypothetical protein